MKQLILFILSVVLASSTQAQNIIALWNYNTITGSPAAPVADVGTGTSNAVGSMVVAAAATGMDPVINNGCGAQNGLNPGAWAFTSNPGALNESSGVQYMASTVGSNNIQFTWDQRTSNTGPNTIRLKYTTDGTTWNDFTMTASNTTFCLGTINANGCFENSAQGDQYRRISVSFTGIPAVENNPNFGVRLLASHFQATGQFRQTSNPLLVATAGTWRFDNVRIEGKANVSIASANNFAQYNENVGTINVPVTVSNANNSPINLTFSLSTYSDATAGSDFTWTNTLTIPANTNGVTNLPITITDDALAENAERIIVKISSGLNALISSTDFYQINFIRDNDYVAPVPSNELNLSLLTSFSNGAAGSNSAEIVAFDSDVDRLYIANSVAGKLDIVNFSNPATPLLINSIIMAPYGNINSVVAHDSVVAVAIESVPAQTNGKVVFFDYNGNYINQVTVGAMPDMLTFDKTYSKIITANEGEPDATYTNDPEGSISIIDLTPGYANLTNANVTTLGFTAYNGQAAALIAQGIRVFSTSASVAQDFEPEYVAVSDDNSKAYVTLQENNAMVTVDLNTNTIIGINALGYSSYDLASGNALDASDQSGAVLITGSLPIKGAYMPDATEFYTSSGIGYLVTANEGDSREFGSVIDANRISSSTYNNLLDANAFPDQSILRNNKFLGRLNGLKYSGDTDGDGDYDELHVMGGRSFTIRNANTGVVIFDSKSLIEQITANHPTFGAIFNASNATGVPAIKNRSDDKGPEPEGLKVAQINGKTFAFVALERIGGAMIFNITNPNNPVYVGYANNRSTSASGPDLGAEGIIYISAAESPNGNDILILANEVSSTLTIYQVNTCAELSGTPITCLNDTICAGQIANLNANSTPSVSYEWLMNGMAIPNATNTSYAAMAPGVYSVKVTNSNLNCIDTSNFIAVTVNPLPNVSAGTNQSICPGATIALSGSGAFTYSWDNNVQNWVPFIPTQTQTYTVTGTDTNGCQNTAQVTVTITALPNVSAGQNQTICAGSQVTLSGSGAQNYTWDNNVLNGVPFSPTTTQTYTVTGIDSNFCQNTAQVTVTVNPSPTVSGGTNQTICAGAQVTLNGSGALTYTWSNNVQNGVAFAPAQTQTYTVTGVDATGCQNTATVTVTVNPAPAVSGGVNQNVCAGASVTLNGSGAATYVWSNNVQNGVAFTPTLTQTYSVIGTDANGCIDTAQVTVVVYGLPNVGAGQNQTVCAGSPVTLTGTGASSYSWNNNVQNNVPFTATQTTTYTVTGTNGVGCTNTAQVTVTVNPLPTVNGGLNQAVCAGNSVTLTGSGANTYAWNNNVQNGVAFTPTSTQTYIVTGTNANGCIDTAQVVVTVNQLPVVSGGPNTTVCAGDSATLNGSGASTYVWNNGISNGVSFIPNSTMTYTVTGTDANGCQDTAQVTLTVSPLPSVNAGEDTTVCDYNFPIVISAQGNPNLSYSWSNGTNLPQTTITTGGTYTVTATNAFGCASSDAIVVTTDPCAGLMEQGIEMSLFPNPFTNEVTLVCNTAIDATIEVFSTEGKLIMSETFHGNQHVLALNTLANGTYTVRIAQSETVRIFKIVKQ
ncbi:MAG: T9SS C-terminal target domain-containing protein [Flavobacteriia bacterium]|nr:T9SS C-terminal target domain-containing protein [Flavobacteriia bacterium]